MTTIKKKNLKAKFSISTTEAKQVKGGCDHLKELCSGMGLTYTTSGGEFVGCF